MSNLEIEDIKKRSVAGVMALTSRTAILQVISFTGTFLLTISVSPEIFGVFFVVSAVVAFLNYFSDIGLAAALVQKEKIKSKDYKTTFTIQQLLVLFLVIIALIFSNNIAGFYNLSDNGLFLLRALIFSFFLSSLKTIPSVILERKLDFNRLVIPQIAEVFSFYTIAVFLAWRGFGIESFTWAVLARGAVGVVLIYVIQPWMPSFAFNKTSARGLLSFGVPFQLNSILGLIKDDLFTLFLGKILPFSQVGYIGWAKKWSEVPLRLIMDSVVKVTFPAYSRLQRHKDKLSEAINKSLFFLTITIFPMAVGLLLIINPLINIIPRYGKWEPALVSFYFFVIGSVLASISTPLTNALNATGKIKTTLKFMFMWTGLIWIVSPILIKIVGFNGVALAHAAIGMTVVIVIWVVKKYLDFSVWANITPAAVGSVVVGLAGIFLRNTLTNNIYQIIVFILTMIVIYISFLFVFYKNRLKKELKTVLEVVKK